MHGGLVPSPPLSLLGFHLHFHLAYHIEMISDLALGVRLHAWYMYVA